MKLVGLILAALAVCLTAAAEESFYRSNEAGMLLERIPSWRRDEFAWVAGVLQEGPASVRRLYERGQESRRWEAAPTDGGARREESEFIGETLIARRRFDPGGAILTEESYRGGTLEEKSVFTYAGSRLLRIRSTGPDGSLLRTDEYLYAGNGRLREVRRLTAGGQASDSRFFAGSGGLAGERHLAGGALFIARYDAKGRVVSRERRVADATAAREDFIYRADSNALLSSTQTLAREGRVTRRQYDGKGRLLVETVSGPGSASERTEYRWDDSDRATSRVRQGRAGLEEWAYGYDAEGTLLREEYRRGGALEKVTVFLGNNTRVEELYAEAELFLKVTWEGERRVKEEVFENRRPVRERTLP